MAVFGSLLRRIFGRDGKLEIRQIAENISVAGQITAEDVESIAALGFRTLISNRPDSEDGAVPHQEIEAAAKKAGLQFHYLPVVSGSLMQADAENLARVLKKSEGPVLAYCRSGARSANLYRLASESQ